MNTKQLAALGALCFSLSLGTQAIAQSKPKVDSHNAKNSLDWAGPYSNGVSELNLFDDNSYYIKNGNTYNSGTFKWSPSGNSIILSGINEQYVIQEGNIKNKATGMVYMKGNAGAIKINNMTIDQALLGGKWVLIELNGKAIEDRGPEGKNPYIAFNENGTFTGHGGCNGFGGEMKAANNFKIAFGDAIQTMMACIGGDIMQVEQNLHNALKAADNYTVNNGILSLNKARMAPLARFKFVKD